MYDSPVTVLAKIIYSFLYCVLPIISGDVRICLKNSHIAPRDREMKIECRYPYGERANRSRGQMFEWSCGKLRLYVIQFASRMAVVPTLFAVGLKLGQINQILCVIEQRNRRSVGRQIPLTVRMLFKRNSGRIKNVNT